tara:strand:+ start:312 stop:989 length:678 start_codon:yes stop_codon:yes gene_type:complete
MSAILLKMDNLAMRQFALEKASPPGSAEDGTVSSVENNLDPTSDEALLVKVSNSKSKEAFGQLFDRFANKVFAHGMKILRNEQMAKDLVQETMLTVWQKAPLYNIDKGNVQSWIFTITRNRCFDMLRKQKRQPAVLSADDIWPAGFEEAEALSEAGRGSVEVQISQIEKLVRQLPAAQQAVVEQIHILNRTHEEAAQFLEIPLGTLKSRLRLAMGKLRQSLGTES